MEKIKNELPKWRSWLIFAIIILSIYKILDNFTGITSAIGNFISIIAPVLFGILAGYLLYIPASKFEKSYKNSRVKLISKGAKKLSILTTYIMSILIIVIIINVILPVISDSVIELASNFQGYYEAAIRRYNNLPEDSILKGDIVKEFMASVQQIDLKEILNVERVTAYAKGAISFALSIFDVFVGFVVSVYVLLEKDDIVKFINKVVNAIFTKSTSESIDKYINSTNQIFYKFLAGQFLDAIIIGIVVTLAMNIIGVKYASLLGFMIAIFNLIPYFGAIVGVAIAVLITIITGGLSQAIVMAIIVIILQQIDANIINPKILGNSLKISPIIIIAAVTIGGAYFGVLGMFLAVPVAAVIKIIFSDYIEFRLKHKEK